MQIVIPVSGFGERFRRAGYQLPKPLIMVGKKVGKFFLGNKKVPVTGLKHCFIRD